MVYDELYELHELAGGNDVMRARLASNAVHAHIRKLEAVVVAARVLVRQWKEEDAGGLPLGWLIDALGDAIARLDEEE